MRQVATSSAHSSCLFPTGFHSLRHAAVNLLREAGTAESVSMAIVGHNDVAVHAVYTHVGDGALRQAVATLPAVFNERKKLPLPPAEQATPQQSMIAATEVMAIANRLSADTWETVWKELLTLAQGKPTT